MKEIKPISLIVLLFSLAEAIAASAISYQTPEGYVAISPTLALTNTFSPEAVSIGPTNFTSLDPLLSAYANLSGRTILLPTNFAARAINLWIDKPLPRQVALQAFDTILGLNGIALISLGEKWIKADHFSDGCQITRPIEDKSVEPFVTHVLQLKHTLPSEVSSVLKPFAKANPEFIVALDHSHILVIRDYPENVKRMLDMIAVIDVPPGPEFQSEVISIKYAPASAVADALYSKTAHFENSLKIIPDESSNSLLIFATSQDMKPIKELAIRLDIERAQVLIEATIVRVSQQVLKRSRRNRVEENELQPASYASVIGQILHANHLSVTNFVVTAATNASAGHTGSFLYAARLDTDLDTIIKKCVTNNDFKIVQRPAAQTTHNEPATIFAGPPRPNPTGSSGSYGSYSTVAQLQLGCTLELTPLIRADGLCVMEIHQKVDCYGGATHVNGVRDVPVISSIESQTRISAPDRGTILLGGLVELGTARSSGVPILKDIPLLGFPFRGTSHRTKNEYIALIRPTILPHPKVTALLNTTTMK